MLKRKLLLSLSLVSIQGCALLGAGGAYQTMNTISTGATAVSYGTTGKGLTDHAVSAATGKDCSTFHMFQHKNFCRVKVTYEVRNMQKIHRQELQMATLQIINTLKEKEKLNESKFGTRHTRHAQKIRSKRSHKKVECKPPRRILGVSDPFLARRTGRNETCGSN